MNLESGQELNSTGVDGKGIKVITDLDIKDLNCDEIIPTPEEKKLTENEIRKLIGTVQKFKKGHQIIQGTVVGVSERGNIVLKPLDEAL